MLIPISVVSVTEAPATIAISMPVVIELVSLKVTSEKDCITSQISNKNNNTTETLS